MTCCGTSPLQSQSQKRTYESPALWSTQIGYNPIHPLSLGSSYGSIADRVLGVQQSHQNHLALPGHIDSGISPKVLYGVSSSKVGSGNYSNETVPRVNYMPMDAGYSHMPSFGTGGRGG